VNVDEFMAGVRERMGARQVFGEPVEAEGAIVVPAAAVFGGGGGGSDEEHNGGGGFGLAARPVGAYVIRGGEVTWVPATDQLRTLLGWQLVAVLAIVSLRSLLRRRS
jgi:uncharacterized spore protein YtfJ